METYTIENINLDKRKLYYSISEVASMLNIKESTLRFWEKDFPFTQPEKSAKGTRHYTQKEIQNIQLVSYLLKERKLTIEGAKKLLKENKQDIEKKHAIVLRLQHIKKEIQSLRTAFDKNLNITEENGMAD